MPSLPSPRSPARCRTRGPWRVCGGAIAPPPHTWRRHATPRWRCRFMGCIRLYEVCWGLTLFSEWWCFIRVEALRVLFDGTGSRYFFFLCSLMSRIQRKHPLNFVIDFQIILKKCQTGVLRHSLKGPNPIFLILCLFFEVLFDGTGSRYYFFCVL